MLSRSILNPILVDEHLTRGLGDAEARMLVEWLVEQVEGQAAAKESELPQLVQRYCRRGRAMGRFVQLWSQRSDAAACQLAASENFTWPLPTPDDRDACDILGDILFHEQHGSDCDLDLE